MPVGILDNDFRDPDLDRYVDRVCEYEPAVGVIGDAHDAAEVRSYVRTIRDLEASFPDTEFIVVPKCWAAIEAIPDDIVIAFTVPVGPIQHTHTPLVFSENGYQFLLW
ncbi:DUF6610 family protein [Haladaptatus halobius]|uniref:DUF6610 family protein n=1 Tax=Haladaptatus halobius TaxID=2884875 RepID=UPI0034A4C3C6